MEQLVCLRLIPVGSEGIVVSGTDFCLILSTVTVFCLIMGLVDPGSRVDCPWDIGARGNAVGNAVDAGAGAGLTLTLIGPPAIRAGCAFSSFSLSLVYIID
jgi:hypothetical protein